MAAALAGGTTIMFEQMWTAGAWRALALARGLAAAVEAPRTEPLHLLWALLLEESRASELLAESGLRRAALSGLCPLDEPALDRLTSAVDGSGIPELRLARALPGFSSGPGESLAEVVVEARRQARRTGDEAEVGSEHLLWGLAVADSPVATVLGQVGLGADALADRISAGDAPQGEPIPTHVRLGGAAADHATETCEQEVADQRGSEASQAAPPSGLPTVDVLRVLDAAANRAREGLRVVEDYARFVLDDAHLTRLLKETRHEIAAALGAGAAGREPGLLAGPAAQLFAARDTAADVGTGIHTESEGQRTSLADVLVANFRRVQEALRTLEEFGKLLSPDAAARLGQARYRLYTLEKALVLTQDRRARLAGCRLYLLVTSALCRQGIENVVREALAAGVDVVQLREKPVGSDDASGGMSDREIVALGRRVREWTREAGALFIMNDRPDLAVLCDADGVHVGEGELTVRDARRIVGPDRLIGVSTHTIGQARQAVLDGADYLGVGPVFPSSTKEFASLAGLEFVRQVAGEIALPWFAIGGIRVETVLDVLDAGARRIAVSGAICGAEKPGEAASLLAGRVEPS